MNSVINKNMEDYFSKLLKDLPENKAPPENSFTKYIKNNIIIVILIVVVIILFIVNIYFKDDEEVIKKKKKKLKQKEKEEQKQRDVLNDIDKQTLLNIIDELSDLATQNYKLKQELERKNLNNLEPHTGFQALNHINRQTTNVNGYIVESPFV